MGRERNAFDMQLRLVLTGLALVLALGAAGCAGLYRYPDPPRVALAGIRLLDLGVFEQRYLLALRVQNPNRFELPIEGMSYTLDVNGAEFAHGVNNRKATIPAYGEQILQVSVVTDLLGTLAQLHRWEEQHAQNFDYRLKGRIQLANAPISLPFEYSGRISLHEPGSSRVPE